MAANGTTSVISFDDAAKKLNAISLNDVALEFLRTQFASSLASVGAAEYIGSGTAAYLIDTIDLGSYGTLSGGFLLSTGTLPSLSNTTSGFGEDNSLPGDIDLAKSVKDAFPQAGDTYDASVLRFDLTIKDKSIDGVQFDIIFGSEEYPEYSDSDYVDIAAIYVNGKNYALFSGNSENPLSILNVNSPYLIDNTGNIYPIEWDGFTNKLTLRVPVIFGTNSIKLAIADTGDGILDSGLYVQSLHLTSGGGLAGEPSISRKGSPSRDIITVQKPVETIEIDRGCDEISGNIIDFNRDTIINFSFNDKILFKKILLDKNNFHFSNEIGTIGVDVDLDGAFESTIFFSGDRRYDLFNVKHSGEDTEISFERGPGNTNGILPLFSFQEQLELIYIGYFNRAGDGNGYNFWLNENIKAQTNGQSAAEALNNIANAFRPQAETIANYALLGSNNLNFSDPVVIGQLGLFIDSVYANLFGRSPDGDGKAYWISEIRSGSIGFGSAILAIVNGAIGQDATIIMNKAETAFYFTSNTTTVVAPSNTFFAAAVSAIRGVDATSSSYIDAISKTDQFISQYSIVPLSNNEATIGITGLLETAPI